MLMYLLNVCLFKGEFELRERETERDRERQRETERDRERDRQRERQTEREGGCVLGVW